MLNLFHDCLLNSSIHVPSSYITYRWTLLTCSDHLKLARNIYIMTGLQCYFTQLPLFFTLTCFAHFWFILCLSALNQDCSPLSKWTNFYFQAGIKWLLYNRETVSAQRNKKHESLNHKTKMFDQVKFAAVSITIFSKKRVLQTRVLPRVDLWFLCILRGSE